MSTPEQVPLRLLSAGARVHLIGVAGAGMNALAAVLLARGYRVSGSDMQRSAQVERLIGQGMQFSQGHSAANVEGAALVIISAAVREENVELAAARTADVPVVKRAAALGWVLEGQRTIAVAGTHGKTTTTAMLAVILRHAGLDPTFAVGGEVLDLAASAQWGSGDWAVVEADEYDRSFLQLRPQIAVITNVEPDHLEYYGSVEAMHEAYRQFIAGIVPGGTLVLNADDPYLRTLDVPAGLKVVACAMEDSPPAWVPARTWRADSVMETGRGTTFVADFGLNASSSSRVDLLLSGRHNVSNAVQACAAAWYAGVPLDVAASALASFHGTGRRFQTVGEAVGVLVIDDYAHHPTEIRATLAAARARYPDRRLVAVFQPHTYSRTKLLFEQFIGAFDDASLLVITDIYAARETDTLGVTSAQLAEAIAKHEGAPIVELIPDLADVPGQLVPQLRTSDIVLTLGAGTITNLGPRLVAALGEDRER